MSETPDMIEEECKELEKDIKFKEDLDKFKITSDCRTCIFSTWTGPKQRGCEFGRIERFRIHGGVEEVITQVGEETVTSYEVQRVCNKHRNNEWAKVHKQDILGDLEKEVAFKMSFLIYLDKDSLVEDFIECLKSLQKQTIKPIDVVVLNNYSEISPTRISEILDSFSLRSWQNIKMYRKSTKNEAINDDGYKHISGQYFGQITLPCVLKEDFVEQIDISLNIRLERFLSLEYENNPNIIVLQTKIAQMLDKIDIAEKQNVEVVDEKAILVQKNDENKTTRYKLQAISKDQNRQDMVKTWPTA